MPEFQGISNSVPILIQPIRSKFDQWVSLEVQQTDLSNLKTRYGLLLCGFLNSGGSLRVIETFKIFGGGLLVLPRWPLEGANAAIVLDWYVTDREWILGVPFDPLP